MTPLAGTAPITDSAIDAIVGGVFAKPDPQAVEAYSVPDMEPLEFLSPESLTAHIRNQLAQPRGLAFVFVVYPDMRGRPIRRTIRLDPDHCAGQKIRYTWDGWGLIAIQLYGSEQSSMSRIAANSAKRASAWASTHPEWPSPECWNWSAVERHANRLQRILRKVT